MTKITRNDDDPSGSTTTQSNNKRQDTPQQQQQRQRRHFQILKKPQKQPLPFLYLLSYLILTTTTTNATPYTDDTSTLISFYTHTNGPQWTSHSNWLNPNVSICHWEGVQCHEKKYGDHIDYVESLILSNNNLRTGSGSDVSLIGLLQSLPYLKVLKLDGNPISFTADEENDEEEKYNRPHKSRLETLDLSHTQLHSFQSLFGSSTRKTLYPDLTNLYLTDCELVGSIPFDQFKSFTPRISRLVLDANRFSGKLPDDGNLWSSLSSSLRYLSLIDNELSGILPSSLRYLSKLTFLQLSSNDFISTIPQEWNELDSLQVLHLSSSGLTGPLPSLNNLDNLRRLDLSGNSLTGTIPREFLSRNIDATSFDYAKLNSNRIEGVLRFRTLETLPLGKLFLEDNLIEGIDEELCHFNARRSGSGNDGLVTSLSSRYGCDGILCSPGTYHMGGGRQVEDDDGCLSCPTARYYGAVKCIGPDGIDIDDNSSSKETTTATDDATVRNVLSALYKSAGGDNWINKMNWLSPDHHVCEWFGVSCSSETSSDDDDDNGSIKIQQRLVTSLYLTGNNLAGFIPCDIFYGITSLKKISLSKNTITINFAFCTSSTNPTLQSLDLSSTNLHSLSKISALLPNLTDLRLEMNELRGTLPAELFQLTKLEQLRLDYNRFTGSIPDDVRQWTLLKTLSMDDNQLSGTLPEELGQLKQLATLRLKDNRLSGTIPSILTQLSSLTALDLSRQRNPPENQGLTGPLISFDTHINLRRIDLAGNSLTGTLPNDFLDGVDRNTLEYVNLQSNYLSGKIPARVIIEDGIVMPDVYLQDNYFEDIELCGNDSEGSKSSTTKLFGCDAILCGVGRWNAMGRRQSIDVPCEVCKEATFLGSTSCPPLRTTPSSDYSSKITSATISSSSSLDGNLSPSSERDILINLYETLNGPMWLSRTSWLSNSPHCHWEGVTCGNPSYHNNDTDDYVTSLNLRSNNLIGTLPSSIYELVHLSSLILDTNPGLTISFQGIEQALFLRSLDVSHTNIQSTVGLDKASALTEFEELFLVSSGMRGPFPIELLELKQLKRLSLALNELTGTIPSQIGIFDNMEFFSGHGNLFRGTIPSSLGQMTKLMFLFLQSNRLEGSIPSEIENLTSLWFFDASSQSLTGSLPSFREAVDLRRLSLDGNKLTGSIPSDFLEGVITLGNGGLDNFEYVDVSHNLLTGIVPLHLKQLPIDGVFLVDNRLTGIEEGYCDDDDPSKEENDDIIRRFGCDGLLCGPKSYNVIGRRDVDENLCLFCPTAIYYGSTNCTPIEGNDPTTEEEEEETSSSSSSSTTTVLPSEKEILEQLYTSCGGPRWTNNHNWLNPSISHCQWYGITCTNTINGEGLTISIISLPSNNLIGTPPIELYQLPRLQSLILNDNPILFNFSEIENAKQLQILDVSRTKITSLAGFTPPSSLTQFRGDGNNLTGPLPSNLLTRLGPKLTILSLYNNDFTGTIPETICSSNLSNLQYLSLANNHLVGALPQQLDQCTQLVTLHIQQNQLTSMSLPNYDNFEELAFFDVSRNEIGGTLPKSLNELSSSLRKLDVSFNKIEGAISEEFLQYASVDLLERVDLSNNLLSGVVPSSLARFFVQKEEEDEDDPEPLSHSMVSIDLTDNQFSGVDDAVCDTSVFGCDGILCADRTCNCWGRRIYDTMPCEVCPDAAFFGRSKCVAATDGGDATEETDGEEWTDNSNDEDDDDIVPNGGSMKTAPDDDSQTTTTTLNATQQRDILISFYLLCGGNYWIHNYNWNANITFCDWDGITCIDGGESVESINLGSNRVTGVPPDAILHLPHLKTLSLYNNKLAGFNFAALEHAKVLEELHLDATGVYSIEGIELAASAKLRRLGLSYNRISGYFPEELFRLENLTYLSLANNRLSGMIPSGIRRKMTKLETLLLGSNSLSGDLSRMELPSSLRVLDLSDNDLRGIIPDFFLDNISSSSEKSFVLDMSRNRLTGTVPASCFERFDNLSLYLNDNYFTGIDEALCRKEKWNDGDVKRYGCDGLLCPKGMYSKTQGRQTAMTVEGGGDDDGEESDDGNNGGGCMVCPDANYYGESHCGDMDNESSTAAAGMMGGVIRRMGVLMMLSLVLSWR